MVRILLTCSGGMSSSMVVSALIREGEKKGITIESKALGVMEVATELEKNHWDVVLVAPQVSYMFNSLVPIAKAHEVPIIVIKPQAYTPLGSKLIIEQLEEMKIMTS